jgi:hypothetical protein
MSAITPVPSAPVHHTPAVGPQTTHLAKPVNRNQIHQLKAEGLSVSQIAQRLGISQLSVTQIGGGDPSANTSGQTA